MAAPARPRSDALVLALCRYQSDRSGNACHRHRRICADSTRPARRSARENFCAGPPQTRLTKCERGRGEDALWAASAHIGLGQADMFEVVVAIPTFRRPKSLAGLLE